MAFKMGISIVLAVVAIFHCQHVDAQSKCATDLRPGSVCVDKRINCPDGTTEFSVYSNFLGCNSMTQKCCQKDEDVPRTLSADRNNCGIGSFQPTSRILDGTMTGVCDWPFVVSIRASITGSSILDYASTVHLCQGVLIDPLWVVTSPFCIFSAGNNAAEFPTRALVVAGEYNTTGIDINPNTGTQQEQIIDVEQVVIHPSYKFKSLQEMVEILTVANEQVNSDAVALIKLREPIRGTCSGIACLPSAAEASNACLGYKDCVITGWGFTAPLEDLPEVLTMSQTRLTSKKACDFLTAKFAMQDIRPTGSICQAPRNRNTDSCFGDEGGAILCSNGRNWVVRGILPVNECRTDRFGIFVTDVAPYVDWIQETILSTATFV